MLERIAVDDAVYALRSEFVVVALTAEGLSDGPSRPRTAEDHLWREISPRVVTRARLIAP